MLSVNTWPKEGSTNRKLDQFVTGVKLFRSLRVVLIPYFPPGNIDALCLAPTWRFLCRTIPVRLEEDRSNQCLLWLAPPGGRLCGEGTHTAIIPRTDHHHFFLGTLSFCYSWEVQCREHYWWKIGQDNFWEWILTDPFFGGSLEDWHNSWSCSFFKWSKFGFILIHYQQHYYFAFLLLCLVSHHERHEISIP